MRGLLLFTGFHNRFFCYNQSMMTYLLLIMLVFVCVLLFIIVSEFIAFLRTRVPFVPTHAGDIEFIVKQLGITSRNTFYDLGSGNGKVVFLVEDLTGAKVKGFELSWWTILFSKLKAVVKRSKASFISQNFFKADWSGADYVYGYLFPPLMGRVKEKFLAECR